MDAREKSGAPRPDRVPARRDREGRTRGGRGRGARRHASRCWRAPSGSSGSARRATPRSTRATRPCSPVSAASGSGSASWRPSIRSSRRTSTRATAIKSQLEDLAFFLRSYADGVDASPERLQQVEDRLALLERLKRKYGPTLQDVIDEGDALARERDLLTGRGRASAEDLAAALDGGHGRVSRSGARALDARDAAASQRFAQRARSACWPTGDGAHPLRGPVQRGRARPRSVERARASTRPSSSCRRTPARTCGRWRGSSRAASCRASCWR